jgi:hypothetical protein
MTHNSNHLVIEGLFLEKTQELSEASSLFRIQLLNHSIKANLPDNILISQQLAVFLQLEALYLLNFRRPLSQSCFNRFLHTYFSFIEERFVDVFNMKPSAQDTCTLGTQLLFWFKRKA